MKQLKKTFVKYQEIKLKLEKSYYSSSFVQLKLKFFTSVNEKKYT